MPEKPSKLALQVAVLYVLFAGAWILLSDRAVASLIPDANFITHFQTLKGMTFVTVTGGLLFVGLLRPLRRRNLEMAGRMHAEKSLRESEERYREVFNATSEAIFVHDIETGTILDANQPMLEMFKMTLDEARNAQPDDFSEGVSPYSAKEVRKWFRRVVTQGPQVFEWHSRRKGGELFWTEVSLKPTRIGGRARVLAVVRDISERKRAETALRESEERYRSLFDNMLNGFACCRMQTDGQGRPQDYTYLAVNKAFKALTGLGDVIGKNASEVTPSILESNPKLLEMFGRVVETGEPECHDMYVEGWNKWLSISVYRLESGHFVSVFDVLTERKQTEAQLRKLSHAVEQSPASIVITDTAGRIEYVNPKFTEVTGYTLDEVRGQNPRVLKSDEKSPEEYMQLWQAITQGREWRGEFHNKKKNGELYWEFASISPIIDRTGRITHFMAVKENITERKNLETQLRHVQKMEAIGQLAGGVAHDFNNILAVIQMQTDMLRLSGGLNAEHLGCADEIEQAAERAANLTSQLLLFSRRQAMRPRDLDLNDTVTDIAKMLQRLLGENIRIHVACAGRPLFIHADPGMMDQVLLNLAVNSRDAMPNGGRLTIETSILNIGEHQASLIPNARPGACACLTVMDNGTGIGPGDLPRIFEPFFTTKDVGKGTGLGLAIVFGIVQQHKGWIDVHSAPGAGTTFRVHFPLVSRDAAEPARRPALASSRGGTETVLVTEDDPALRALLRSVLSRLGYRLLEAPSGIEALHVWEENRDEIDLLLTDLVMPDGMGGIELAHRLREKNSLLKIVYMSGHSPENAARNFTMGEGASFISKPFRAHQLAEIVRATLDRQPAG